MKGHREIGIDESFSLPDTLSTFPIIIFTKEDPIKKVQFQVDSKLNSALFSCFLIHEGQFLVVNFKKFITWRSGPDEWSNQIKN